MSLDIQYKIGGNKLYQEYLRNNSHWYKELNRNPNSFKLFEEEVKKNYKLRTVDKIEKVTDTMDFISKLMSVLQ